MLKLRKNGPTHANLVRNSRPIFTGNDETSTAVAATVHTGTYINPGTPAIQSACACHFQYSSSCGLIGRLEELTCYVPWCYNATRNLS